MIKQIFINLAVKDPIQSMGLYTALGFNNNPQFSDTAGKCMVWSDSIFVMLLSHEKFKSFVNKSLADTHKTISGIYSLSFDDKVTVDQVALNGIKAGGNETHEPRDLGFMYQRTIEDFDGHLWELFYLDPHKLST